MNEHKKINELLVGFALGELSQEQANQVRTHLVKCHECSEEIKHLEALLECTDQINKSSPDEQACESARQAIFQTVGNQEIRQQTSGLKTSPENIWRIVMKSRIAKLATVAAVIAVIIAGISFYEKTSPIVWAEVVKQINNYTRYECRERLLRDGVVLRTVVMYHLNLSQRREEYEDGTVSIFDLRGNDAINLQFNPAQKKACIIKISGFGSRKDPDIINIVKRFDLISIERLGKKEKNGKTLYGFKYTPDEYNDYTVWADKDTKLPVEIEIKHPTTGQTTLMDEFEFDFDLDPSAFSTDVPEGYEVITKIVDQKR